MIEFGQYIIDVLAEFGGGAGDPHDEYTRFGLGAIFFSVLLVISIRNRHGALAGRESYLAIGFALGLLREVFKFVIKSLDTHGGVETATLELFFPPLEHAIFAMSRVVIAAGFIYYFLGDRQLANRFLAWGGTAVVAFYVVSAPIWWQMVEADPLVKFSHFGADWVIHGLGVVFGIVVTAIFLRSKQAGRTVVALVFFMFLLDDLLQIVNLAQGEVNKAIFGPIRHNLHIWAIALLGFVYLREQAAEKRRIRAQLEHRERMDAVGQLAAGVAHDFNNLLQIILGFTELARHGDNPDEALDQIEAAGHRGADLIKQLLTYSRQDGNIEGQCEVDACITRLASLFENVLGPEYAIVTDLNAGGAFVNVRTARFEQILTNLFVNARDAISDGGRINVSTQNVADDNSSNRFTKGNKRLLKIRVSDTGHGMSPGVLSRAFQPFFTTKEVGKGTGLGLATVYGIVQDAHGSIEVQSEEGNGTAFTIMLPVAEAVADVTARASSYSQSSSTGVVLIAEDEPALLSLVSSYLTSAGLTVIQTNNGTQALEKAKSLAGRIDVMLLDVAMPEMTGYAAYKAMEEHGVSTPVIFMTGRDVATQAVRVDAPHIGKPFSREELQSAVQGLIAKNRAVA